ncbi:MAG: alpha/beta hydrolase [Opitutus sp.]|nr:alpha/beta hydrolase [Opitutus sp.]
MLDRHLNLPDGRALAYAEFGRPDGLPVLYFHGAPSSRFEPLLVGDEVLHRLGLRVIAPDRPGMGGSTFRPGRGFADWPRDVVALADSLGLDRFAVWGYSGGGPYVAACAAKIPARLTAAVIVAGAWRMDWPEVAAGLPLPNRLMVFFARRAPWLLGPMFQAMASLGQGAPEKELAGMKGRVTAADYAWFAHDSRRFATLGRVLRESLRPGTKGAVWDMRRYVHEFDFRADEIRMPLRLFHGEQDANYPLAAVRRALRDLPSAQLVTYADEAHLSLSSNRMEAVAAALGA